MITWGVNALNHGSSLAVFSYKDLVFYKSCKEEKLDNEVIKHALSWGGPETVYWYERPWYKKSRQLYAGQWNRCFDLSDLPSTYLKDLGLSYAKIKYTPHHASHAAAGYYTSEFKDATIIVLDAIGEWECVSIWSANGSQIKKIFSKNYPNSLGLFYSAFTHLVGLVPIVDEGTLQQWAAKGDPVRYYQDVKCYFNGIVDLRENLHQGVRTWQHCLDSNQDRYDIAAAVQRVFEEQVCLISDLAKKIGNSNNLVYMGGCAFNSQANKLIEDSWNKIWSLPNPGDASSSIGAVLYHKKIHIPWSPFYGVAKHIKIK